ncbi:MAG: calcium-binding protein [Planctomycetota bacterium]
MPQPVELSNGSLTINDTFDSQLDTISLGAELIDGRHYVTINGKPTKHLATDVEKIAVYGGGQGARIDLAGVTADAFPNLSSGWDHDNNPLTSSIAWIRIVAGGGDDVVIASPLGGQAMGGAGDDRLQGAGGTDWLVGGLGDDLLLGGGGGDFLHGEEGSDNLRGEAGNDFLYGGDGEDQLDGGENTDQLFGEGGNDRLSSGNRAATGAAGDLVDGGTDSDTYLVSDTNAPYVVIDDTGADDGRDLLDLSSSSEAGTVDLSGATTSHLNSVVTLIISDGQIEDLRGTSFGDILTGNSLSNTIWAGAGNDTIKASPGNDTLAGEAGDDTYQLAPSGGATTWIEETSGYDTVDLLGYGSTPVFLDPSLVETPQPVGGDHVTIAGAGAIEDVPGSNPPSAPVIPTVGNEGQFPDTVPEDYGEITDLVDPEDTPVGAIYEIEAGSTLSLTASGETLGSNVGFSKSLDSPIGLTVHPTAGVVSWDLSVSDVAPGDYPVTIHVTSYTADDPASTPLRTSHQITVRVTEPVPGSTDPEIPINGARLKYPDPPGGTQADATIEGEVSGGSTSDTALVFVDYGYSASPGFEVDEHVFVEFDSESAEGSFVVTPRSSDLDPHADPDGYVTVGLQAGRYIDDPTNPGELIPELTGSIRTLTFKPDYSANADPIVDNEHFELVRDTGISDSDRVTHDPTLKGSVTNADGRVDGLRVRFYDTPPTATTDPIDSVLTDDNGDFEWAPDPSLFVRGQAKILYAWAEDRTSLTAFPPAPITFTYDSIDITLAELLPPTFTSGSLEHLGSGVFAGAVTANDADWLPENWSIQFMLSPTQPADGVVTADGTVDINADGTYRFVAPPDFVPADGGTIWVRAIGRDAASGEVVSGINGLTTGWESLDVLPLPTGSLSGTIADNGGGSPSQLPTLSGMVQIDRKASDPVEIQPMAVSGAVVEFWLERLPADNNDRASDRFVGAAATDADGNYTFSPPLGWGEAQTLYAQVRYGDSAWVPLTTSSGIEVTRAQTPDAVLAGPLTLVYDVGGTDDARTRLPVVEGQVDYTGRMSDVVVEFDYAEQTEVWSVVPEEDGSFAFAIPGLPEAGMEDVSIRAQIRVSGVFPPEGFSLGDGDDQLSESWFEDYSVAAGEAWLSEILPADGSGPSGTWYSLASRDYSDQASQDYVTAPSDPLVFDYDPAASWGASATAVQQADATDPTLTGQVTFGGVGQAGLRLAFYLNGDTEPDGFATTDGDGNYEYVASGYRPDANSVRITAFAPVHATETPIELDVNPSASLLIGIDAELTVESVALSNPEGGLDPTLSGRVLGTDNALQAWIEVDYEVSGLPVGNTVFDGEPDAMASTGAGGEFSVAPDSLFADWGTATEAGISARYRVVVQREKPGSTETIKVYGEWSSDAAGTGETVDWTAHKRTARTIAGYALAHDTGPFHGGAEVLDRRTADPTVEGRVANGGAFAPVELAYFDAGGAQSDVGVVEVVTDGDGYFRYTPVGLESDSHYDLRARVVETDMLTGHEVASGWATINDGEPGGGLGNGEIGFVLVDPEVLVVDAAAGGLTLVGDDGNAANGNGLHDPTIEGTVVSQAAGYPMANAELDFFWEAGGERRPLPGYAVTGDDGSFRYTPVGIPFETAVTVIAVPRQSDRLAPAVTPPETSSAEFSLQRSSVTGFASGPIRTVENGFDAVLSGVLNTPSGSATPLYVEIEIGDRVVTADVVSEAATDAGNNPVTQLAFRYAIDLREADSLDDDGVRVRLVEEGDSGLKFGDWTSNGPHLNPPVTGDFGLATALPGAVELAATPILRGSGSLLGSFYHGAVTANVVADSYVVEFDYDGDGFADASEFVDGYRTSELDEGALDVPDDFQFSHELAGFEPGSADLRLRVTGFVTLDDGEEVTVDGRWVDWNITIPDPAPVVNSVSFDSLTGGDLASSASPTLRGVIASPLGDAEPTSLYVEIDEDGDGEPDGQAAVDTASGELAFSYTLRDTTPRELAIQVRAVDGGSGSAALTGPWTRVGVIASPFTGSVDLASLEVQVDTNSDNSTDFVASGLTLAAAAAGATAVDQGGQLLFAYSLDAEAASLGQARVRLVDTSGTQQGDWESPTGLVLSEPERATIDNGSFQLEDSVDDPSDPVTSNPITDDPVLIGSVTSPAEAIGRRVEFDHDGDGLADGFAEIDAFGNFRYEPETLPHGDQVIRARVVDQVGDRVRGQDPENWPIPGIDSANDPDEVLRFFHDSVTAATISGLRVVDAERGIVEGRATVDGYGVSAVIRFDLDGDPETSEASVQTSADGYFRYEFPELMRGTYTVNAAASVDDPYSEADVDGPSVPVTLDYGPRAFPTTPPAFVGGGPALAYGGAPNGNSVTTTRIPVIKGTISNAPPQTFVDFTPTGGGETTRVAVRDDGSYEFLPVGLEAGEHTYDAELVAWDPDSGWWVDPSTPAIVFDLENTGSSAPTIVTLDLAQNVAGPGEQVQVSAESVFKGSLDGSANGYVGPIGGLPVYFDHNGDGVDDGVAYTLADGSFTYRTDAIEPGDLTQTITATVHYTDYWGDTYTEQEPLRFELTRAPLIADVGFDHAAATIDGEVFYETAGAVVLEKVIFGADSTLGEAPSDLQDFLDNYAGAGYDSESVSADGGFSFAGPAVASGEVTVYMRAVHTDHPDYLNASGEVDSTHDSRLEGPWRVLTYQAAADVAAPEIDELSTAAQLADGFLPDFDGDFLKTSDPTVSGSLGPAGANTVVEVKFERVDSAGAATPAEDDDLVYRTTADAQGRFPVTALGASRSTNDTPGVYLGGRYHIQARSVIYDSTIGGEVPGTWNASPVKILLIDPEAPTVSWELTSASSGMPGAVFKGRVSRADGGRVQGLRVDLDIVVDPDGPGTQSAPEFEGTVAGSAFTDSDGYFEFVYYGLATAATAQAKARVYDWDAVEGEFLEGEWSAPSDSVVGDNPADAAPELNEVTLDEYEALLKAATAARQKLETQAYVSTDGGSGKQYVETAVGKAQLLHLGGNGVMGDENASLDDALVIKQGSTTGDGAWAVDPGTDDDGVNFFAKETAVFSIGSTPTSPIVSTEVIGDEIVTTSVSLANLIYEFDPSVIATSDDGLQGNTLTIDSGYHRVAENLAFDFWITRAVTPIDRPSHTVTTVYAGHYDVTYEDGSNPFTGLSDLPNLGAPTLGGGTPIQEFIYEETYFVDSWTTTDGDIIPIDGPWEGPSDRSGEGRYQAGTEASGKIENGDVVAESGEVRETITVSSEETTTNTSRSTTTTSNSTENTYETRTETIIYSATLTTVTTYLSDGVQIDFDFDESLLVNTTLSGGGTQNSGDSSGGGDYDNSWWNYQSTSSGNYQGGASGTLVDRTVDGEALESIDANVNGNSSGNVVGSGGAGTSFSRTYGGGGGAGGGSGSSGDEVGGYERGSSAANIGFNSDGSSSGAASVNGLNDDVSVRGDSSWSSSAGATITANGNVSFATPYTVQVGASYTRGNSTTAANATASGSGGGNSTYSQGSGDTSVSGGMNSSGSSNGTIASNIAGRIGRFEAPETTDGSPVEYVVPFKNNTLVIDGGNAGVDVNVAPLGSESDTSAPGSVVLYSGKVDGADRTVTISTEYVGLESSEIDEGFDLVVTHRTRDETENYTIGNSEDSPVAAGDFTDDLTQRRFQTTFAKGTRDGVRADGTVWEEDWESLDIAYAYLDQDVKGDFSETRASTPTPGEPSVTRAVTADLTQDSNGYGYGVSKSTVTESRDIGEKGPDGEYTGDYDAHSGTHNETVTRNSNFKSDTTGFIRLANDVVLESITDTDFGMTNKVKIEQNGNGTTNTRTTVPIVIPLAPEVTTSNAAWSYDRTINGKTEVPDGAGHTHRRTTPEGSYTKATLEKAEYRGDYKGKADVTGDVKTIQGAFLDQTDYTRREKFSGDNKSTVTDSEEHTGAFESGNAAFSSYKVESKQTDKSEVDTTWNTKLDTPNFVEITKGHTKPETDTTETFDGTVRTGLGVTLKSGDVSSKSKNKAFVDTDINKTWNLDGDGNSHTLKLTADVDMTTTTTIDGKLVTLAGVPLLKIEGEPTIEESGGYKFTSEDVQTAESGVRGTDDYSTSYRSRLTEDRGGAEQPQVYTDEGVLLSYSRDVAPNGDVVAINTTDLDAFSDTTTKQGERGLQRDTLDARDWSKVTTTQHTDGATTVRTETDVHETENVFVSDGDQAGDKQQLDSEHRREKLDSTVTRQEFTNGKPGGPIFVRVDSSSSHWDSKSGDGSYRSEVVVVTTEDATYHGSHPKGGSGEYQSDSTRATTTHRVGSGDKTFGSTGKQSYRYDQTTSTATEVHENGSYSDVPSDQQQSGTYTRTAIDAISADPDRNYEAHDSGSSSQRETADTKFSADKYVQTVTTGGFGNNRTGPPTARKTGRNNNEHTTELYFQPLDDGLNPGFIAPYTGKLQRLKHNADGSKSGSRRQEYSDVPVGDDLEISNIAPLDEDAPAPSQGNELTNALEAIGSYGSILATAAFNEAANRIPGGNALQTAGAAAVSAMAALLASDLDVFIFEGTKADGSDQASYASKQLKEFDYARKALGSSYADWIASVNGPNGNDSIRSIEINEGFVDKIQRDAHKGLAADLKAWSVHSVKSAIDVLFAAALTPLRRAPIVRFNFKDGSSLTIYSAPPSDALIAQLGLYSTRASGLFAGPKKASVAPKALPALRQQYVDAVEGLSMRAAALRAQGKTSEQIARTLHAERRALGQKFKDRTPPDKLAEIHARNLEKYGDKLGPSIDYLRGRGKTWEDIIESASRVGGKDLGF